MAHTKGPWEAQPARDHYWPINGAYRQVALVEVNGSESRDNARLIAAAPDLLAAVCKLQMIAEEFQRGFPAQPEWCREIIEVSRAAIAKATGTD